MNGEFVRADEEDEAGCEHDVPDGYQFIDYDEVNEDVDESEDGNENDDGYQLASEDDPEDDSSFEATHNSAHQDDDDSVDEELERAQRIAESRIDAMLRRQFGDGDLFTAIEQTTSNEVPQTKTNVTTNNVEDEDEEEDYDEDYNNFEANFEQLSQQEVNSDNTLSSQQTELIQQTLSSLSLTAPEWAKNNKEWLSAVQRVAHNLDK
ncbi:KAT6A [Acrasis kona]|uniref:KAT6A n=1 Tax=Acrasis kona TaxID=1008807 RepID=A0AAW2ZEH1_9EUKA